MAFDPGKTTGYAVMELVDDCWKIEEAGEFNEAMLIEHLISQQPTWVLYERFHLVDIAVDKTPIEVIGVIKYIAGQHGYAEEAKTLIPRSPGDRYFASRRYGEPRHKSVHARSAINHAIAWLYTQGYRRFECTKN